jgi:flavin-dependent dehydrogenase
LDLGPEVLLWKVEEMAIHLPAGQVFTTRSPGYVIARDRFDQHLASRAEAWGAQILTGTRAVSKENDLVRLTTETGEEKVRCLVVVGADGPTSTVGGWIGQRNRRFIVALQQRRQLPRPSRTLEIYFSREYPGGYAWLFPKGDEANVGVGVSLELGGKPLTAMQLVLEKLAPRLGPKVSATGGRIPVGGPLEFVDERARVVLVGDAAGQTHPITGGGIAQAVICGQAAGKAAARAAAGAQGALADYSDLWEGTFGSTMKRALRQRNMLVSHWDEKDLDGLIRRCWVAGG